MEPQNYFKILILSILTIFYSCEKEDPVIELSSENKILSFELSKNSYSKAFDVSENSVEGTVDSNIELKDITLHVKISEKASITPSPSSITSITDPFTFTVVGENGDERIYNVSISRELSTENSILEFRINHNNFSTFATINNDDYTISQRLPQTVDLSNLDLSIISSERATITPDIDNLIDFSETVSLTVTSESGIEKTYSINIDHMDEPFSETCSEMNASKWFGGDNRTDAPDIEPFDRNVGTGQTIILDQDLNPSCFSIHLSEAFKFDENGRFYNEDVELKLNIRNSEENIITETTTTVPRNFNSGFITFDLTNNNLFLEDNTLYIFQWYLIDGETLGISASSLGSTDEESTGFCFNGGYSGQSNISENTKLEDYDVWRQHPWNFNFILQGKQ